MNRRRRAKPWLRAALIALVAVAAVLLAVLAVRLFLGALRLARTDGGSAQADPQFAQPAEAVTRPPEPGDGGLWPAMEEDPSENRDLGEQTPVDKTAEELSREAEEAP